MPNLAEGESSARCAREHTVEDDEQKLSPEAAAALAAGLASARRGEIKPWGSFSLYLEDDDRDE